MLTTSSSYFFFFNDPATTEIYTLSLHDALPICAPLHGHGRGRRHAGIDLHRHHLRAAVLRAHEPQPEERSEEHTSELQSRRDLVCRLLLEKKKKKKYTNELEKKYNDKDTCYKCR